MAAKSYNDEEWDKIMGTLRETKGHFGLPERVYGSVVLGSFNIRKLGSPTGRNQRTWEFLAHVCRHFDFLAVQEIQDNLKGLQKLMGLLGPDFGLIVSDATGTFPGGPGLAERLGFIFNWRVVQRTEIATDITFDRSRVLETLALNRDDLEKPLDKLGEALEDIKAWEAGGKPPPKPKKPTVKVPVFITFIRQPFCVSIRISGHIDTEPYEFMAVNAHLFFGDFISDRRQEFEALMEWILARVKQDHRAYYPNFLLSGDLNLDFNNPEMDRQRIEKYMKSFNNASGEEDQVNFPFLDPHPKGNGEVFRTNARLTETFDQIGLFSRDRRLPDFRANKKMGTNPLGPDYGVFNFVELFSHALKGRPYQELSKAEKKAFQARFEHKVSDHMPLWIRLPLPTT
ncbi:MAG: endonuclease/exonuclease/phosphatase [Acidobacteriota bacterium]